MLWIWVFAWETKKRRRFTSPLIIITAASEHMSPFLIKSCFRCPLCSLFVSQRAMWHTSSLTHFSSECVSLADSSRWCWSECTDLIGWVAAWYQMHCWVGGRRWEVILQAVSSGDHEYLCTSLIHPIVINQSGSGPNPAGYHPLVCVLPFCILNLDKMAELGRMGIASPVTWLDQIKNPRTHRAATRQ